MEIHNASLDSNRIIPFSEEKEEKEVTSKTLLNLPVEIIRCVLDFLDQTSTINFLSSNKQLLKSFYRQREIALLKREISHYNVPTEIRAYLDERSVYSNDELRMLNFFQFVGRTFIEFPLKRLNLCNNQLTDLPPAIGVFTRLKWLYQFEEF